MDDLKKDLQDENPALPPLPPIPEEPKKIPDAPINPPAQKEEEKYSPLRSMEYGGSLISHPQGDIEVIWPYGPKFATPPDYPPVDPPIDPPIIPPILPPIGPPGTPELPPDPPIAADSPPLKGEICCVGFNPENSMFEAIITIDRRDLFGAYCGSGTVAHVGFWLKSQPLGIWPPDPGNLDGFKFIGESTLRVYGADGGILGGGGPPKYAAPSNLPNIIHYAIHHKLPPEMVKFIPLCDNVNLPQLHCVLTFTAYDKIFKKKNKDGSAKVTIIGPNDNPANVLTDFAYRSFAITNKNYKGIGLKWAATQTVDIQFPKKSARGNWQYLERASQEAKTIPIHAIQLRNKKILMFSGTRTGTNDTACLFDPDTNTFQSITSPLTLFKVWGNPQLPLYGGKNNVKIVFDTAKGKFVMSGGNVTIVNGNPTTATIEVPVFDASGNLVQPPVSEDLKIAVDSVVHDVFCSTHNLLPDGRIFIIGGQETVQLLSEGGEEKRMHIMIGELDRLQFMIRLIIHGLHWHLH